MNPKSLRNLEQRSGLIDLFSPHRFDIENSVGLELPLLMPAIQRRDAIVRASAPCIMFSVSRLRSCFPCSILRFGLSFKYQVD